VIRPHTPFVIGFHGCDRAIGMQAVCHTIKLKMSTKLYHWLGSGIYFWENDRERAFEWAVEKASRGELKEPFVIGGVIELRKCLDLSVRENTPLVKEAHDSLLALYSASGISEMPENKPAPKDNRADKVMRYLDCAVINHLARFAEQPFDTVRGLFVEGGPIYPGGEIYHKTHAEIAVRNPDCIMGLFLPR
jgi:hypothetical protein